MFPVCLTGSFLFDACVLFGSIFYLVLAVWGSGMWGWLSRFLKFLEGSIVGFFLYFLYEFYRFSFHFIVIILKKLLSFSIKFVKQNLLAFFRSHEHFSYS